MPGIRSRRVAALVAALSTMAVAGCALSSSGQPDDDPRTVVVVTHELASIFTIGNNSVFLDPDAKTMTASGHPKELWAHSPDPKVRAFLRRGEKE